MTSAVIGSTHPVVRRVDSRTTRSATHPATTSMVLGVAARLTNASMSTSGHANAAIVSAIQSPSQARCSPSFVLMDAPRSSARSR